MTLGGAVSTNGSVTATGSSLVNTGTVEAGAAAVLEATGGDLTTTGTVTGASLSVLATGGR